MIKLIAINKYAIAAYSGWFSFIYRSVSISIHNINQSNALNRSPLDRRSVSLFISSNEYKHFSQLNTLVDYVCVCVCMRWKCSSTTENVQRRGGAEDSWAFARETEGER